MIRTILSLYIVLTLFGANIACAAPAETTAEQMASVTAQQASTEGNAEITAAATAEDTTATTEQTCAPPAEWDDFTSADWAYVTRDENSTTYLRMDTITHTRAEDVTISCGDIKKTYTKHGLTNVYHSLKATSDRDDESLALLREIDHAIMHISYRQSGGTIAYRLHQATFYNKSGNALTTFDFDDIALQTGALLTWTPVTSRMYEEFAIFCRLANG